MFSSPDSGPYQAGSESLDHGRWADVAPRVDVIVRSWRPSATSPTDSGPVAGPDVLWRPFGRTFAAFVVVDVGSLFVHVNRQRLVDWSVTPATVWATAFRRAARLDFTVTQIADEPVITYLLSDDDITRVLIHPHSVLSTLRSRDRSSSGAAMGRGEQLWAGLVLGLLSAGAALAVPTRSDRPTSAEVRASARLLLNAIESSTDRPSGHNDDAPIELLFATVGGTVHSALSDG